MVSPAVLQAFERQAALCSQLGSPFYVILLEHTLTDLRRGGAVAQLLGEWQGDPLADALPLRFLGGLHRLVLAGAAPALATFYPSVGGHPVWPALWDAVRTLVELHADLLRPSLAFPPQTNEVQRSAALLGGFLAVAESTGLPLRLLELGSSAGLNLCWDRYYYTLGPYHWGNPDAAVHLAASWDGPPAPWQTRPLVRSRAGCDLAPIDLHDRSQAQLLESFVWADQRDRLATLRAAIAMVGADPPALFRGGAVDWLAATLNPLAAGSATVVFHSVVWPYMAAQDQQALTALLEAAGARATATARLAWLRLEAPLSSASTLLLDLRLTLWPGGNEMVLAQATPHGRDIRWLGAEL